MLSVAFWCPEWCKAMPAWNCPPSSRGRAAGARAQPAGPQAACDPLALPRGRLRGGGRLLRSLLPAGHASEEVAIGPQQRAGVTHRPRSSLALHSHIRPQTTDTTLGSLARSDAVDGDFARGRQKSFNPFRTRTQNELLVGVNKSFTLDGH